MLKLLLFATVCGLGYKLVRTLGSAPEDRVLGNKGARDDPTSASHPRVEPVDAEFEDVDETGTGRE